MSPVNVKCEGCGRTVQAPEAAAGKAVKCPTCGQEVQVPGDQKEPREEGAAAQLVCQDCKKVFRVPAQNKGQVVSCPSCGSWVKTGVSGRSVLYQNVPTPFQFSAEESRSILWWLRFMAGAYLLAGLGAAVWIGIGCATKIVEGVGRALNPPGIALALGAVMATILGTVILLALYWILQTVSSIHNNTRPRE